MKDWTLEICIDSVASAIAAEEGGAQRVELCAALYEGGLTPSMGMIEEVLDRVQIDVMVIIRPRGGDFFYSDQEVRVMERDIRRVKALGCKGVVMGTLNESGELHSTVLERLLEAAEDLEVTFHRAFDMGKNPYRLLDDLIELGIPRLLTSGQEADAFEGRKLIAELVQRGGDDISVMAGGGVHEKNVYQLIRETGIDEVHATCSEQMESPMKFRRDHVYMGVEGYPEFQRKQSTKEKVSLLIEEIKRSKG